jgi:hypothetical protein
MGKGEEGKGGGEEEGIGRKRNGEVGRGVGKGRE